MKLQAVFYDQDEEMSAVQVLMSADEAAFLVKVYARTVTHEECA